jgi:hypothetical protein
VEDAPNTFKTSIGNLPPKSEVVISVVYITDLEFNSDNKVFPLPLPTLPTPATFLIPLIFFTLSPLYQIRKIPFIVN